MTDTQIVVVVTLICLYGVLNMIATAVWASRILKAINNKKAAE